MRQVVALLSVPVTVFLALTGNAPWYWVAVSIAALAVTAIQISPASNEGIDI